MQEYNANTDFEKQQNSIKFHNMDLKHQTGWWRECPYKSYGSIMHWLYVYGTVDHAERVTIRESSLELHGEIISPIIFNGELQMPIFNFIEKYSWLQDRQTIYLNGLKELQQKEVA